MSFLDDWKEWSTAKKAISILVVCCIGLIVVSMITGALSPDKNTSSSVADNSAEKTYDDGTYKVGSDLPAGEYKFTQTSTIGGYVERASDSSMELESIISNEATSEEGSTVYITVNDGEYLKIQGGELTIA
ncbi:MAG: hypothetical protein ACI389_03920 [Methanobrevibacter sp.]|uniref:hypothetical protein n=1 Tax=Methanobrevibacter sp. TaxID=66852 RepID=UPI003F02852B